MSLITYTNKKWLLKSHPNGLYHHTDAVVQEEVITEEDIQHNEILVEVNYLSIDGFLRTMLDKAEGKAFHGSKVIGDTLPALGVGKVVITKSIKFKIGNVVTGMFGAQSYAKLTEATSVLPVPGMKLSSSLGLLGVPGLTAWCGLYCTNTKPPKKGDVVVVSAAAGATGSIAAQLAKAAGAKVIGVAGGQKKVEFLKNTLKLDGAIDYKSSVTISQQLEELCPDGVDYFYDNVGGEILDAVLGKIRADGRIVICGGISQYSGNLHSGNVQGPKNYLKLAEKGAIMVGFNLFQYLSSAPKAVLSLLWHHYWGSVVMHEHIEEGIESFSSALEMMFTGGHIGRLLVRVKQE